MNNEPKIDSQEYLQERLEELQRSFEQLSSQIIKLKENVQKRKKETTTLKILLYTGLFLLLVGFIYSNTTLQRVQLKILKLDFQALTYQTNQNLNAIKEIVLNEMQQIKASLKTTSLEKRNKNLLSDAIVNANKKISQIQSTDPKIKNLIKRFTQKSNDLLISYKNYIKELSTPPLSNKKAEK